jgi:hypothetical protein
MSATNRILLGALAGIAATCAMTAAARAMHRRLPASERYFVAAREIVESGLPVATKRSLDEHGRQTATIAAHRLRRRHRCAVRACRAEGQHSVGRRLWCPSLGRKLFRNHARPPGPSAGARSSGAPQCAHDPRHTWSGAARWRGRCATSSSRSGKSLRVMSRRTMDSGPVDEARAGLATLAGAPGDH